jgi:hypothetical protein
VPDGLNNISDFFFLICEFRVPDKNAVQYDATSDTDEMTVYNKLLRKAFFVLRLKNIDFITFWYLSIETNVLHNRKFI